MGKYKIIKTLYTNDPCLLSANQTLRVLDHKDVSHGQAFVNHAS